MISFKNVTYKINNKVILQNVTFNIKRGEKVLIMGPSGCGKTTIFNLLLKNIKLTSGTITYEKENLYNITGNKLLKYRQKQITVISQNDDLFDHLTVLNNLTLFYHLIDVEKALKKANLYNLKDRYVYSLSGGERQKVAIVKASLSVSNVLLCDEITSALDIKNSINIIEFVLSIFKDKTIIFISHNKEIFENKIDHYISINNHTINENIILKDIKNNIYKEKPLNRKSLLNVSLNQAIKKCSFTSFLIFLLSIISFFISLNFDYIFSIISHSSYTKYIGYDVLLIKDNNNNIELDINNNIYPSIDNQLNSSNVFINNIKMHTVTFIPYKSYDNSKILVSDLLVNKYKINKIDSIRIQSDLVNEIFNDVQIIKENNMFSKSCIYYDIDYFYKYYDRHIDNNLYIVNYNFNEIDDRFTNNPMYENKKEDKPYLENNALFDYLTFKMIFDSIKTIVNYFFSMTFMFSLVISILINISMIIKDKKQIAIYISKGYSDFQIMLFYIFPLLIYSLLFLICLYFINRLLSSFMLTLLIQLLSIIISYYFIKKKSLNELLKSEYLS